MVYGPASKTTLKWDDPQILGIIVAIFAVFLSIVLFTFYLKKKVKQQGILLVGLSDSGKTLLFSRLAYDRFCDTYTSIKENIALYQAGNKNLELVDIPGQERVRNRIFDEYKSRARGIVFVIDSLNLTKEVRDVAEYLYDILSDETIQYSKPSTLILCNKQDEPLAKGSSAIKTLLEKELNLVRKTKTSQLDSIDNKSRGQFIGYENKDFEFEHLAPQQVTFAESICITASEDQEPDISKLEEWLLQIA